MLSVYVYASDSVEHFLLLSELGIEFCFRVVVATDCEQVGSWVCANSFSTCMLFSLNMFAWPQDFQTARARKQTKKAMAMNTTYFYTSLSPLHLFFHLLARCLLVFLCRFECSPRLVLVSSAKNILLHERESVLHESRV